MLDTGPPVPELPVIALNSRLSSHPLLSPAEKMLVPRRCTSSSPRRRVANLCRYPNDTVPVSAGQASKGQA